jgi:uncharacterized membrane protein
VDEVERAQVQSSRRGLVTRAAENPVAGFIPWIIFWVVASSPSTWEYGAIGAALAAVILALPSASRRRPKILDVATIVFFVAVAVIGAVVGAEDRDWLDRWSMVLSSGALGLIALGSLAFVPFTEQYAREETPPEMWGNPEFRRINRVLTLVWGLTFLATAVLGCIAVIAPSTSDWTNWILPIVLIVGAFKFTARYPQRAGAPGGQVHSG